MGKILFIRGGAVGDFILTLPAIDLVRSSFPDVRIEILGYESIACLALAAGLADEVRPIEHASLASFFAPGAKLDEEVCSYFRSFDVVISYLYDPDEYFLGNLNRAEVDTLLVGPYRMDESEKAPSGASQLALPLESLALFLEKPYVELDYGESKFELEKPCIAIHPGSGSPSKNWSLEAWVELLIRIRNTIPQCCFLVSSGEAETETIGEFISLLDAASLPYHRAHDLPLPELGRRLAKTNLFLGHDSGISHLAASTGIDGFLLFGKTDPQIWAPQNPSISWYQAPGGQLGNVTADTLWNCPQFQKKLGSVNKFPNDPVF